jgi:hypothetical protein
MHTFITRNRKRLAAWTTAGILATVAIVAGTPTPAAAQAASAASPHERADELFTKAREAIQRKKFDVAHPLLVEAWSLRQADDIAGLLGQVELELGKHRDAAEHLTACLRLLSAKDAAKRQRIEESLEKARREVATVDLDVSPQGAQVLVDGTVAGLAPLADPIFLDPGEHTIEARLGGWEAAQEKVIVERGARHELSLVLARPDPAPATVASASPQPTPLPSDSGTDAPSSARTTVLTIEGAVLAVGLVVGTVYAVKTHADADDIASARAAGPADGTGCSRPEYASQCSALRDARDRHDTDKTIGTIGFVAAGVAGLAGAATLLFWPSEQRPAAASAGLFVSPGGGVVSLTSSF